MKQGFLPGVLLGLILNMQGALAQVPMPVPVTLVAPGGARAALEVLIPRFEASSGYKVAATFGSGLGTKKQIAGGEAFDVPVLQPPYPEVLASGHVDAASVVTLASVAVGIAVPKGARKPDISTPASLRATLLAAKSISYPDPAGGAAAGVSFELTLQKLGIAEQLRARLRRAQGGAGAMAMVAKGEAEIGLTFLSEMSEPGIDIVGPLPLEISTPTVLTGLLAAHPKNPAGARALLTYLASPAAASAYREQHMIPAR